MNNVSVVVDVLTSLASRLAASEKARAEELREHIEFAKEMEEGIDKLSTELDASNDRVGELTAARIAYASEFDGDVGSIHENIRKMKKRMKVLEGVLGDAYQRLVPFGHHGTCRVYCDRDNPHPQSGCDCGWKVLRSRITAALAPPAEPSESECDCHDGWITEYRSAPGDIIGLSMNRRPCPKCRGISYAEGE